MQHERLSGIALDISKFECGPMATFVDNFRTFAENISPALYQDLFCFFRSIPVSVAVLLKAGANSFPADSPGSPASLHLQTYFDNSVALYVGACCVG